MKLPHGYNCYRVRYKEQVSTDSEVLVVAKGTAAVHDKRNDLIPYALKVAEDHDDFPNIIGCTPQDNQASNAEDYVFIVDDEIHETEAEFRKRTPSKDKKLKPLPGQMGMPGVVPDIPQA